MGLSLESLVLLLPGLIVALSVHEFAHAAVADALGDPTPRRAGRLTLEPWAHLDPVGTLMLLVYRFGWAKPVPVNPYNFRRPHQGMLWVALAGPAANLLAGFLFAVGLVATVSLAPAVGVWRVVPDMMRAGLFINAALAAFNLIPVPPLDGSRVLAGLLPRELAQRYAALDQFGPLLLIVLLVTGAGGAVIAPLAHALQRWLLGLALVCARILPF
jgi:Zn-dependent protease